MKELKQYNIESTKDVNGKKGAKQNEMLWGVVIYAFSSFMCLLLALAFPNRLTISYNWVFSLVALNSGS